MATGLVHRRKLNRFLHHLSSGLLLALLACATDTPPVPESERVSPIAKLTGADISVEDERELGFAVDRAIQKELRVIQDPIVTEFLFELGQSIVQTIDSQPFLYRFRVIDDPRLNAFAIPGGYIYFHSETLLSAVSIDEVAGVMAHEIGHIKGRHYVRQQQKMALPNLLAAITGIAASVAAENAGPMIMAQAANVALQLSYSREFEAESDRLGMTFMTRAGYDAEGMARFFERIALASERSEIQIPPYLYTHPEVKERAKTVRLELPNLHKSVTVSPDLIEMFYRAQQRLTLLRESRQSTLRIERAAFDRTLAQAPLDQSSAREAAGENQAALELLQQAEARSPSDPRPPYQAGLLFTKLGRHTEAIQSYRRTLVLDPDRPQLLYRLGLAYKAAGDPARAIFYLDRAAALFRDSGTMKEDATWEVEKIDFPLVENARLQASADTSASSTSASTGKAKAMLQVDSTQKKITWSGSIGTHYLDHPRFYKFKHRFEAQWLDPQGHLISKEEIDTKKRMMTAQLAITPSMRAKPGRWEVRIFFENDVVAQAAFALAAP